MIEADLALLARLYLRGYGVGDMVERLKTERQAHYSYKMVSAGLLELHKRWLEAQILDFGTAKARELAKLDQLEVAYWEGWERSVQAQTHTETELVNDVQGENQPGATYSRSRTLSKTTTRDGNAPYLQGVERCIKMRCEILGLFSATKLAFSDWRQAAQEAGIPESQANQEFEQLVAKYQSALE